MKFNKLLVGQKFQFEINGINEKFIKTHPMEVRYFDDVRGMEWGNSICLEDGRITDFCDDVEVLIDG
jgi:hypothetical protein